MISWRIKTDRPPDLPPSRTARLAWRLVIGLLVVVLGAFLLIWLAFHKLGGAETSISRLQHGARQLYSQAVTAGASPVTTPPGAPPASRVNPQIGPQGDRGPGPTAGQIADAVDAYCAVHDGCRGVPSQSQVKAAVRAFCAAGACRGPAGRTGSSGSSGPSGARGPSGAAGPAPTSDQIGDAVAAYCAAHGGCTGPAGPTGPKGDTGDRGGQGDPGVGISSIDCTGLGIDQLVVHYDDGRTQAVPCSTATPSSGAPSS